jgi:hypothetical protein
MTVGKAISSETQFMRDTARSALANNPASTGELEQVFRDLMFDAFGTGAYAASQQIPGSTTLPGISGTDWAAWQPGDTAAAELTANGGLADLLDGAGIGIKNITGSVLDQLGNRIGDGLAAGNSVDAIARDLRDIVGSPSRAEMIAHTETARATTVATLATYGLNGVTEWDWVVSDDPCAECADQESQNPHPLNDKDQPPLHPRCRCAVAPVVDTTTVAPEAGLLDEGALQAALDVAGEILQPEALALTQLTDDQLGERLGAAGDNTDEINQILEELDRREAETQAAADLEARAAEGYTKQDAEYDRLLESGTDPEHAFEQAYGTSTEKQRREAATSALRAEGYTGHGFRELMQQKFNDMAADSYLDAERETRGFMLNAAGRSAGIDPRSLFTGPESRARKYASDELRGYWQERGRLTVDKLKANALGGTPRYSGEYWL